MIHLFAPSTIDHPWRTTWAVFAVSVWTMILGYYLLHALVWAALQFGHSDWSFVPVQS